MLLGKFTSDHIEKEFGKLRQGCGGCYFITAQQIMEKVAIYKTKLLLRLDPHSDVFKVREAEHSCNKCGYEMPTEICLVIDDLPEFEKKLSTDIISSLVHIAGFVISKLYEFDMKKRHSMILCNIFLTIIANLVTLDHQRRLVKRF